jgi:hypothetical protein
MTVIGQGVSMPQVRATKPKIVPTSRSVGKAAHSFPLDREAHANTQKIRKLRVASGRHDCERGPADSRCLPGCYSRARMARADGISHAFNVCCLQLRDPSRHLRFRHGPPAGRLPGNLHARAHANSRHHRAVRDACRRARRDRTCHGATRNRQTCRGTARDRRTCHGTTRDCRTCDR